jgi:hypothetical protein
MNFEDDSSDDYYEDWDYEDPEEEEEEDTEEAENFKLQNNCIDLYSAMKEYTGQLCLPMCQYLNPQKLYEFTQKYKSS